MDLVLAGGCDARSLLLGLRRPEESVSWASRIDLSEMRWCEPAVLVGIAALAEAEVARGQFVAVAAPRRRSVANYLARMHLGEVLSTLGAEHDLPGVDERDADSLLELRIFNGSRGAEQLARLVDKELRASGNADIAEAVWEGICETGQNVEQHSGRRFGFLAAQAYRATSRSPKRRFMFAVADAGRGVEASLAFLEPRGGEDALRLALRRGVSESDDPARGIGLAEINGYLRGLGGGLVLVSDDAGIRTHAPRRVTWRGRESFRGTVVQGEICR